MSVIFVYITNKDEAEAKKVSELLLKKRLAACTNMFPISSMYWWKGKMENAKEVVCIAKTVEGHYEKIKNEVKKIHSYSCPCIIKITVEANKEYKEWLEKEINGDHS